MKGLIWFLAVVTICALTGQAAAEEQPVLKTKKDFISYGVGVEVARNFRKQKIDFDADLFIKGLKDELAGNKLLVPEQDLRKIMHTLQADVRRQMVANRRTESVENKKKEDAFLAANKKKKGVIALPSGLQYQVIKEGSGKKPADGDTVVCNYSASLIDGTEFEATDPGQPASLVVSKLVAGWKEAMKMMPAGSRWKIFVPAKLAYGERGMGSDIEPNATVIYDVELLAIK